LFVSSRASPAAKQRRQMPRMSGPEPMVGLGMKPGDRYAVPLCIACHAKELLQKHSRIKRDIIGSGVD
jgi:hypothetical protein